MAHRDFSDALKSFLEELGQLYSSPKLDLLVHVVRTDQGASRAHKKFVDTMLNHSEECFNRDTRFLKRLENLFPEAFRLDWTDVWKHIDADNRETVWGWLEYLVDQA